MWFDDQCGAYPADHPGYCYCTGMAGSFGGQLSYQHFLVSIVPITRLACPSCYNFGASSRPYSIRRAARGIICTVGSSFDVLHAMRDTSRDPCMASFRIQHLESTREFAELKMTACIPL
jgi:hypothetical protein